MVQQQSIPSTVATTISSSPNTFSLYITNYQSLLPQQQKWLKTILQQHFFSGEISEYRNVLKVNVTFANIIHTGQYMRQIELLIFRLRCNISPLLRFEPNFRYE